MTSNLEKMIAGEVYEQDDELLEVRLTMRESLFEFNHTAPRELEKRARLLKKIFGKTGEKLYIEQPFHCDYGFNVTVGENFFANASCTFLDVCPITIGDDCLLAPNVGIYTAGHALDPVLRKNHAEYGAPVTIGNNVWIGANSIILPGVTIGDDAVIGAGSLVNKDIPAGVLAVGHPCKIVREFNEHDKMYYFKDKKYPAEYSAFQGVK